MSVAKKRNDDIRAALNAELDAILGDGLGAVLADLKPEPIERVSTGSILFDWALAGGLPYGRMTEVSGPPLGGKSVFAIKSLVQIQRQGHEVAYIDSEHEFDPEWGERLGLDFKKLRLLQPETAEDSIRCFEALVKHEIRGIVLDSIPAVRPEEELTKDVAEIGVGGQARLWSRALGRLKPRVADINCCAILINQMRANIGARNPFDALTTAGGWALKHAFAVKAELIPTQRIKDSDKSEIGFYSRLRVRKNRGPMGRQVRVPFIEGQGWSREREVLDLALAAGLVAKSTSWFSIPSQDLKIGQGYENTVSWLIEHPDMLDQLETQVIDLLRRGELKPVGSASED